MQKPDPEENFDLWLAATVKEMTAKVASETAGMRPDEIDRYWLVQSLKRLLRLYDLRVPDFLIKRELTALRRRVLRATERDNTSGHPG